MSQKEKTVISIGTFDGVHLGHQKIIQSLLKEAKQTGNKPVIVTFFPHPTHVLTPDKPLKMLNSIDERIALIKSRGIETVLVEEFTKDFADQTAFDFIKNRLLADLQMETLIVGYDHSFGKGKEGDYNTLKQYGEKMNFKVLQVDVCEQDGQIISSTTIRNLIIKGAIEQANKLLSYPFCLFGEVVKGNQLGRKIGFHTANVVLDYPNKIVPKRGVYIVESNIDDQRHYGMMNIGYRPTLNGKTQTIEVHYFNLSKDLYNQNIKVKVLKRIRDEFKFDSIDQLQEQLIKDKKRALKIIEQWES